MRIASRGGFQLPFPGATLACGATRGRTSFYRPAASEKTAGRVSIMSVARQAGHGRLAGRIEQNRYSVGGPTDDGDIRLAVAVEVRDGGLILIDTGAGDEEIVD